MNKDKRHGLAKLAKTLSPTKATILHALAYSMHKDVPIWRLHARIYLDKPPHRLQQQRVGSVIARLNKILVPLGFIIKPGDARRTYRLRRIEAE